jgi:hypothetical protein
MSPSAEVVYDPPIRCGWFTHQHPSSVARSRPVRLVESNSKPWRVTRLAPRSLKAKRGTFGFLDLETEDMRPNNSIAGLDIDAAGVSR